MTSLLQAVDIVSIDKKGTRHVVVPGQVAPFFDKHGDTFSEEVAGLWIYSALSRSLPHGGEQLVTSATASVSAAYLKKLGIQPNDTLAPPGGLVLAYDPCAGRILREANLGGTDYAVHKAMSCSDFEHIKSKSILAAAVGIEDTPCLFVPKCKNKPAPTVQVWNFMKNSMMDMHMLTLPVLMRPAKEIANEVGMSAAVFRSAWEAFMYSVAAEYECRYIFIGWKPTQCNYDIKHKYTRQEFDAHPDLYRKLYSFPETKDVVLNIDVLRGMIPDLLEYGYVPTRQGSIL